MIEQALIGTTGFLTGVSAPGFLVALTASAAASLLLGMGIGKAFNQIRRYMS